MHELITDDGKYSLTAVRSGSDHSKRSHRIGVGRKGDLAVLPNDELRQSALYIRIFQTNTENHNAERATVIETMGNSKEGPWPPKF